MQQDSTQVLKDWLEGKANPVNKASELMKRAIFQTEEKKRIESCTVSTYVWRAANAEQLQLLKQHWTAVLEEVVPLMSDRLYLKLNMVKKPRSDDEVEAFIERTVSDLMRSLGSVDKDILRVPTYSEYIALKKDDNALQAERSLSLYVGVNGHINHQRMIYYSATYIRELVGEEDGKPKYLPLRRLSQFLYPPIFTKPKE